MISHGDIVRTVALARSYLETSPTPSRIALAIELLHELEWRTVNDCLVENIDLAQTEFEEFL